MRRLLLFLFLLIPATGPAADVTACGALSTTGTTYTLQNDVSSDGTCFVVTAKNIKLDLNGHTVTYDNKARVDGSLNGGFEDDDDGWTLSANASIYSGTYIQPVTLFSGSKSARIQIPNADQAVTGTTVITLAANTTYMVGGFVYNGVSSAVTAYIRIHGGTTASQVGRTYRGFQFIRAEYTTGAAIEEVTVDFGISGGAEAAAGYIYFDDIRIQRTRVGGIVVGPPSWQGTARISDLTAFGDADGAEIYGGAVTQGVGKSDWSPAVYVAAGTSGFKVHDMTLTASGIASAALKAYQFISAEIYDNDIYNAMEALQVRDHFDGAAISNEANGYASLIHDNSIHTGIQTGIRVSQTAGQTQNKIYLNAITLQAKYTNDFAIVGSGAEIYQNTITCGTGENACRGILSGENASGTLIHNNEITVQELEQNQEYDGCQLGGAYGIQVESGNVGTKVYENTVTVNAVECEAAAMRFIDEDDAINNLIYDNSFTAVADGEHAKSLKVGRWHGESFQVYDNTFVTNDIWIDVSSSGTLDPAIFDNTWETAGELADPFYPFMIAAWADIHWIGKFCDNSYGAGDQARFENSVFREDISWPSVIDTGSSFTVEVCSEEPEPPSPTDRTRGALRLRGH